METISLYNLLWIFIPVGIVIVFYALWIEDKRTLFYAIVRMFLQLILIGYFLTYIFQTKEPSLIVLILIIMLVVASLIAIRPLKNRNKRDYLYIFISIFIGSVFTLIIVILGTIKLSPWFEPYVLIPIAGMIFANSMNAVSLAAERFESEIKLYNYKIARARSLQAALIPIINSLFAVGVVSLPGIMTGQILSGVSPLIAVRYQIMVMLMILGSAGISVVIYLILVRDRSRP